MFLTRIEPLERGMDAADIFLIAQKSIDIFTVHCNAYFFYEVARLIWGQWLFVIDNPSFFISYLSPPTQHTFKFIFEGILLSNYQWCPGASLVLNWNSHCVSQHFFFSSSIFTFSCSASLHREESDSSEELAAILYACVVVSRTTDNDKLNLASSNFFLGWIMSSHGISVMRHSNSCGKTLLDNWVEEVRLWRLYNPFKRSHKLFIFQCV